MVFKSLGTEFFNPGKDGSSLTVTDTPLTNFLNSNPSSSPTKFSKAFAETNNAKLKFHLGDIRDEKSVENAVDGIDFIFHAAALKQVPSCEFYPMEAVKTNIIGAENLLNKSIKANVKKIICLSTDKAVYPINAMGVSKSMMEKVVTSKSRNSKNTRICITRYGNVIYSRGSVVPLFLKQIIEKNEITVTEI